MPIHHLDPQLANHRVYWHAYGCADRGDGPDAAYYVSGQPYGILNGVTHSTVPPAQVLPALRERLADVPWAWRVTELAPAGTHNELLALGGHDAGAMPVMALETRRYRPPADADGAVRVRELPDGADLADWVAAYGPPMGLRPEHFPALTALDAGRSYGEDTLTRFVADVDGRVVATTELLVTGDVAGVYLVATLETYRRRGLATALVHAAVGHAVASGAHVVTLQASSSGAPVYARLGFQEVSTIHLVVFAPTVR
ncbi:GNAT family N-acetyltransferase [Cellulomonas shaoxiangyii]|uniref:GNAT family N-acetyltransferase n=1 Tax=Cellulomonas shaoxiangyii TaxID=2566013 RepID=A0A4P7SFE5_9CELL|nr:GNAT family N-acetyltransferase [Cellulomonas shaoxiangyii]QCB92268.1 GNAT family N-acetyltransferase [Cellulomonas shaoxiangyii]TGY85920.1 GNAT family N-acetyltransferase [Cellulomonas shaoxiangyii]